MDKETHEKAFLKNLKSKVMGHGEWLDEEDYLEFIYNGITCRVIRGFFHGGLCGYCIVPQGHKYFGVGYNDIPYDVHGGLTYSEFDDEEQKIYVIGFDCAHSMDISPALEVLNEKRRQISNLFPERFHKNTIFSPTYKNMEFVKNEVQALADQIKKDMQ